MRHRKILRNMTGHVVAQLKMTRDDMKYREMIAIYAFSGACPILVLFFFFSFGFPQQAFQITQQTQTTPMKKPNPAVIPTIICVSIVSFVREYR